MRIVGLILPLLLLMLQLTAQEPFLLEQELGINTNITSACQDDDGIMWLANETGLVRYNGFETHEFPFPEDHTGITSNLLFLNSNLFYGSETGELHRFDIKSHQHQYLSLFPDSGMVTSILHHQRKGFLFSSYGGGLCTANLDFSQLEIVADAPRYVYEMKWLSPTEVVMASDDGVFLWNVDSDQITSYENLPYSLFTHVTVSPSGMIWASDFSQGVVCINPLTRNVKVFPTIVSDKILDLVATDYETIISTSKGVFSLSREYGWMSWRYPRLKLGRSHKLFIDDEYNLWIFDRKYGVLKGLLSFQRVDLKLPTIQSILTDKNNLWVGSNNGLYCLDRKTWEIDSLMSGLNVTSMTLVKNHVLVGTLNRGLLAFDRTGNFIRDFIKLNDFGTQAVLCLYSPDEQTCLTSTLSGLHAVSLSGDVEEWKMVRHPLADQMETNYIMDITSGDDKLFFANDKAGIDVADGQSVIQYSLSATDSSKLGSVHSVAQTDDQRVWLSSEFLGLMQVSDTGVVDWKSPHGQKQAYSSIIPLHGNRLLMLGESIIDLYELNTNELISFNDEIGLEFERGFLNNFSSDGNETWFVHGNNLWVYHSPPASARTAAKTILEQINVNLDDVEDGRNEFDADENNFTFRMSGVLFRNAERLYYTYMLEGFDTDWRTTRDREVSYPQLNPGDYELKLKATHDELLTVEDYVSYRFTIHPPFYLRWWFIVFSIIVVGFIVWWIARRRRRNRALQQQLRQLNDETQLINLKSQLNPHFLFNSFNTMIGLIEENPRRGIQFIEKFTDFYRGVLEIGEQELVEVPVEIELVKNYLHLLKERMGEGLLVDLSENLPGGWVPILAVQMLIENAVKHNIASPSHPLQIRIYAHNDNIVVENNRNIRYSNVKSFGIGLSNIKKRYELLYNKQIMVEESTETFKVFLPVIPENIRIQSNSNHSI